MELGKYNTLTIARKVDFGAYLADEDRNEVLLPGKYLPADAEVGDELDVFVYNDSSDRPIATTERPLAQVNELAYLKVTEVNEVGAFLDWGLSKNLLVPFREQKIKMRQGGEYLVFVYRDDISQRISASAKIEKFIDNAFPEYKPFEKVAALVTGRSNLGYKVVVDNKFSGIIYENEVYRTFDAGDRLTAYVKKIRDDGKLDLTLLAPATERIESIARMIEQRLERNGGSDQIGDFLSPDYINASFQCSKKDFKKAVGLLLKERRVEKMVTGLRLLDKNS